MSWLDTIKVIAPTVATALGSPLAGAAILAIGELFGMKEPTQGKIKDLIESGNLTGEMVVQMKELELRYKNEELERGFKYAELEFKDVDSARGREIAVKDHTNQILAYIVVIAFISTAVAVLGGYAKVESVLAGTIIGYVSAKCEQVLSYYFGSSKSSARKTEIIAQSDAVK